MLPQHLLSALKKGEKYNQQRHKGFELTETGGRVGSIRLSKTLGTLQFALGCTGCVAGKPFEVCHPQLHKG